MLVLFVEALGAVNDAGLGIYELLGKVCGRIRVPFSVS
jgi:hypothetical protein